MPYWQYATNLQFSPQGSYGAASAESAQDS